MNLVLSGPIDDNLRSVVADLSRPRAIVRLHARAYRFEGVDGTAPMRPRIADLCDAARVDHAYVEEGKRFSDFKLLAMDMDSTLITIECIDEIADFAGKKQEVAAITAAAMRGEITDFAESLRRRVALLAGTPVEVLDCVRVNRLQLAQGAEELLAVANSKGILTLLVSGGFSYYAHYLQQLLGISEAHANELEIKDGKLTGQILGPIVDSTAKANYLTSAMQHSGFRPDQCIAIGDGANDLKMIAAVETSVAFRAKPILKANARLKIDFGGLNVLLDYYPT